MCALHPIFFGFIALLINWRYLCMYDLYPHFSFPIFLTTQSILPSNLPICLMNVPRSSSIIICTISTFSWLWHPLRCRFFSFLQEQFLGWPPSLNKRRNFAWIFNWRVMCLPESPCATGYMTTPQLAIAVSPLIKISEPIKFGLSDLKKKRNFKIYFLYDLKLI